MLKAINTKILLAILAALTAIGGAVTYQRHEAAKAAAAAAKRRPSFSNSRRMPRSRKRDEAFRQQVEAGQEAAQLRRRARRQDLAELHPLTHERELRYGFRDIVGPGITERKFRRGLALPVHQQSDQSHHAERRRADAAWTDGAELHRPLHAHQHGHQLEHVRDDAALPYASSPRRRSDELSAAAHHLLPAR